MPEGTPVEKTSEWTSQVRLNAKSNLHLSLPAAVGGESAASISSDLNRQSVNGQVNECPCLQESVSCPAPSAQQRATWHSRHRIVPPDRLM